MDVELNLILLGRHAASTISSTLEMNFKLESEALVEYAEFLRSNYDSSEYSDVVRVLCAPGDGVSRASHPHSSEPQSGFTLIRWLGHHR